MFELMRLVVVLGSGDITRGSFRKARAEANAVLPVRLVLLLQVVDISQIIKLHIRPLTEENFRYLASLLYSQTTLLRFIFPISKFE